MNKSQLVSSIAKQSGLSLKDSTAALNAFLETVKDTLAKGDSISLVGFGTFLVRDRAARIGRNPRTKEPMKIAASKLPSFRAGKALKDAVAK